MMGGGVGGWLGSWLTVQKIRCQLGLMVQDSTMTFENLSFYFPKSTCSLLTLKPTGAIFTDRSGEIQSGNI